MELEFFGTGTSVGVPMIGCKCPVCTSADEHDKRLRASVMVRTAGGSILIDCGPDFRTQILRAKSQEVDALILTHTHYDHTGGIDDLRPYCYREPRFPIYARAEVLKDLYKRMSYSFSSNPYPGSPVFDTYEIADAPFECLGVEVVPLPVYHGSLLINGYRIGDLAYITDAKTIPESTMERLAGVKVLVVNALRCKEHMSHMMLSDALAIARRIKPERAYFTHMSHEIGLHREVNNSLPEWAQLAHDGLVVEI